MVRRIILAITPLFWRVIVFLIIFLVVSGIFGPRIVASDIMFSDGFAAYGGIGKALIFGLIAFWLLVRHNKQKLILRPWHPALIGWICLGACMLAIAWICVDGLLAGERTVANLVGAHAFLLTGLLLAAYGCFGSNNTYLVWRAYQREMCIALALSALFYIFLIAVYALWQPLASVVMLAVNWLLGISGLESTILPPNTLLFDKFGITIAEFCSGVESIALFTSLYAVVGLLEWKRLRRRRYFYVFPIALLALFALNILRVYGLILAGYYINPEIAFSLFHTYAGMVFFVIYSAIFWSVSYRHLLNKPEKRKS